jgi:NAD(P)-dependent dehydrogenase (short-subunit alcohol dehydrogenase family)
LLLTHLLLDILKQSAPARIVNVSSSGHIYAPGIAFWNLRGEYPQLYHGGLAYSQSKLALHILTFELARRLKEVGVTANCFCPGLVDTTMAQPLTLTLDVLLGPILRSLIVQSPSEGAQTGVYLATSPAVSQTTGEYFQFKKIVRASPIAHSKPLAERLWRESTQMIGRYHVMDP